MVILFFFFSLVASQWITSPQLDCRRVHPSFCCTSRIRSLCPIECSAVQCNPEYYQQLYSTDLNSGSSIRDGSAGRKIIIDQTPPSVPFSPQVVTVLTKYPTLIPFEPNIDEIPDEKSAGWITEGLKSDRVTTLIPITIQTTSPPSQKKSRTPDPRIIRPPDGSLVLIGDYEEGDESSQVVSNTGVVTLPSNFIKKEDGLGEVLSRSIPSPEKQIENGVRDGVAARKKDIAKGISSLINQFKISPSETGLQSGSAAVSQPNFLPFRPPETVPPPPTSAPWAPDLTPSPVSHPPGPSPAPWRIATPSAGPWQVTPAPWIATPSPSSPQCGIAPQFSPCILAEVASAKLLDCCRQKNLPPGCQSLCRYDITQPEVRAALDRGQCGLLHVAPFLECAAQGKDNSECCSVKGVAHKTGPQCLQFCRPNMGLTALGLQHIVCGNAIGDMLSCHHSGIRV